MLAVLFLFSLCCSDNALADLRMRRKVTTNGMVYEDTIYIKGARHRVGGGAAAIVITDCEKKRTVMVFDYYKSYVITPLSIGKTKVDAKDATTKANPVASARSPEQNRGVVTMVVTHTDTGERKQLLGYNVRRIKSKTTFENLPAGCPYDFEAESDGWYTDIQSPVECLASIETSLDSGTSCIKGFRYRYEGVSNVGLPLWLKTTQKIAGQSINTTEEILDISTEPLDPALFEGPAGYRELASINELGTAIPAVPDASATKMRTQPGSHNKASVDTVGQKRQGLIRVGIVTSSKSKRQNLTDTMRDTLIIYLTQAGIDAVPLEGRDQVKLEAEAKEKECDYILYSDLSEIKKFTAAGKGTSSGKPLLGMEENEVRIDFKLIPMGQPAQLVSFLAVKEAGGEEAVISKALEQEASLIAKALQKPK
jgi:hypothetical protein